MPSIILKLLHNQDEEIINSPIHYCIICKPYQPPPNTPVNPSEVVDTWKSSDHDLWLYWNSDSTWTLNHVEGHGGFDQDDFVCTFSELEEVVDVVLQFFFGTPTVIDGWVVRFHRHPELMPDVAEQALRQAQQISKHTFLRIRAEIEQELVSMRIANEWEKEKWSQFIEIFPETASPYRCFLRRNSEQAFLVHT
jgi:hypothetical protein